LVVAGRALSAVVDQMPSAVAREPSAQVDQTLLEQDLAVDRAAMEEEGAALAVDRAALVVDRKPLVRVDMENALGDMGVIDNAGMESIHAKHRIPCVNQVSWNALLV
jgi:hypothetical protein